MIEMLAQAAPGAPAFLPPQLSEEPMNFARQQRSRRPRTSPETPPDRQEQPCWRCARRSRNRRLVQDLTSPPTPQREYRRQLSADFELTIRTDTTQGRPAYIGPDWTGFT